MDKRFELIEPMLFASIELAIADRHPEWTLERVKERAAEHVDAILAMEVEDKTRSVPGNATHTRPRPVAPRPIPHPPIPQELLPLYLRQ
jgi:hypothetical protein